MASQVGITLVKRFYYRGDPNEEFSNTYHLSGSVPSDATAWRTLVDALIAQEKTGYSFDVQVIRAYGYDSDSPTATAVFSVDLTVSPNSPVSGTLSPTGGAQQSGDCAVWVRWKTSRLNSRGKPIYLRKYFHDVFATIVTNTADTVLAAQKTALNALGAKLQDGSFAEARTVTARGHTDTIVSHGASSFVTTRTLKRRGKRPGS